MAVLPKAKSHERDIRKRNQLRAGHFAFRLESPSSCAESPERSRSEQRAPRGPQTEARQRAARPGASISRRRCRGAPPRDSPHSPGASFLARPAIRLVESQRHELAPALRAALQRRPAARGHAALSIRHEFLSGLRSVLHRRPLAGRAKRPLLPAVAAIARGYFRGARRQRRGRAHRAKQSHRASAHLDRLFPLDRRQAGRLRPLRRRRPAFRFSRRSRAGSDRDSARSRYLRLPELRQGNRGFRRRRGAASERPDECGKRGFLRRGAFGARRGTLFRRARTAPLSRMRRAERVSVPRVAGVRRVPNGQEVISIAGGLELNTPVWANEMHEYPYLQWQAEVHRAKLKAAYPHAANKIESSPSQGAEDVYARV